MNQKDYKAIAEIIKDIHFYRPVRLKIFNKFADYFEKEDLEYSLRKSEFNREQFLKNAGVK